MAHKTLVGGTAYEISGGKPLVNGTAYSIDNGKTLVGGTVYEVGFGPAMITITLEGIAQSYVEIGDDYYRWKDITVEVPSGTLVRCCNDSYENRDKESWIYHNDTMVVDGMGLYEFTATKNTTIRESSWKSAYGTYSVEVYITEE